VKKIIFKVLKVVLLALFLMAAIVPLYWVIVTSLKGNKEIYSYPIKYFPESPTLENYVYLFEVSNFGVYFRNSALVALVGSMGALLISTFSGYAISRLRKKRTKLLLILAMYFTQMIPTYMVMVPLFTMFASIGKTDNLLSLSLVYINMMIAFSTIMGKSFFDRIPVALEEAAMIDGCTPVQVISKVIVPLALPGMSAIFSFSFINIWNELFLAVMLLSSESKMTIPVALNSFISKAGISWGVLSAGIVVALLPTIIVFAFAQRYIIMGLTEGAVKE
jgi:multiple sugar transport system permease protein